MKNPILIMDGTNQFLRCYSATPTMDLNGNPNGGIVGILYLLGSLVSEFDASRVFVVWDGIGGSQKRRSLVSSYKQRRRPVRLNRAFDVDDDFSKQNKIDQRNKLGDYLDELPLSQIIVDNIEADDSIAYLCRFFDSKDKIIVSNDSDFLQLVNSTTKVYNPVKKVLFDVDEVKLHYGVHPVNFSLLKTIIGDKSDNVKGIKGMGIKSVLKYFPQLSSSEQVSVADLIEYMEKSQDQKHKKILSSKNILESNFKILDLHNEIISASSVMRIQEQSQIIGSFNMTSFRVKMMKDGITKMSNNFFSSMKLLEMRKEI